MGTAILHIAVCLVTVGVGDPGHFGAGTPISAMAFMGVLRLAYSSVVLLRDLFNCQRLDRRI